MKPAERKRLAGSIRALIPDLREKGRLLAAVPRGRILRGLYLEDSSDPTRVYVWAFVQPLYTPASTIVFNLGKRLGGGSKTWSVAEPDAIAEIASNEGVPFFGPLTSPEELARWPFLEGQTDPHTREARAYSFVACGRFIEGISALRELTRSLAGGTPWMVEMGKRAQQLADLGETNPDGACELLVRWEAETAAALHVQDLN